MVSIPQQPNAAAAAATATAGMGELSVLRKVSSVAMIILLYTAATPFSPFAWITSGVEGSLLLDRFLAGVLLLGAVYFQWRIAAQAFNVAISLPTGSRQVVRNGRIETTSGGGELVFIYKPADYWKYMALEAAVLGGVEYANREIWRRCIVSGVIAALWGVGWHVTPQSVKNTAWDYLKWLWFCIAVDEVRRVGMGGGGRPGARRW